MGIVLGHQRVSGKTSQNLTTLTSNQGSFQNKVKQKF